jgi:trehalose 6-phosphate phosphatase
LFLDVDGTLLDFAVQPDRVSLPAGALPIIQAISDRLQGAVALVSGRPLEQLDRLFAPLQLPAAGLHGHQYRGAAPGQQETSPALEHFKREAARFAGEYPGVAVEDKGSHVALHWRAAPQAADYVRAFAETIIGNIEGYRLQPGDHVVELVPAHVDKGRAVMTMMRDPPFSGRTPVFIGDDLTDEYGFEAVHKLGGWSVLVGERETSHATYALADPAAVHVWLRAQCPADALPTGAPLSGSDNGESA